MAEGLRAYVTAPRYGAGSLAGASPYSYTPAYGGKPQTPNPVDAVSAALSGNMANMGQMTQLGQVVNDFNYSEMLRNAIAQDPNYAVNRGLMSTNAQQHMMGNITDSTKNLMGQEAAERGIARGGILTNADYLRSLGRTAEELEGKGAEEYTSFLNSMLKPDRFDVTKSFISPGDIYNAQMQANMIAAAPDPYAKAMAELSATLAGLKRGMNAVPGSSAGTVPSYTSSVGRGFTPAPGGGGYGGDMVGYATNPDTYHSTFDWGKWASGLPGANTGYGSMTGSQDYNPVPANSYDEYDNLWNEMWGMDLGGVPEASAAPGVADPMGLYGGVADPWAGGDWSFYE